MKLNKSAVIILQWDVSEKESSSEVKKNKSGDLLPNEDRKFFWSGIKKPANQTPVYYLSEEVLKSFRQMNPRDVANVLVNAQARKI